ncbi:DMT family transporter [Alphaproteobacteria bacterium]|nr:DMT family transporter [Alphaproteobacteria bacterium]
MSHDFIRPKPLDFVILLVLSIIWGSAFGAIKIAVDSTGPFSLVAVRTLVGFLVLFVFLALSGGLKLDFARLPYRRLLAIGFVGTLLPFFLISWAEQTVDSAVAGLLNGAGPLVTVLGAHFITRDELMTKGRLAGVLLGLVGIIILMQDGLEKLGTGSLLGQIALVVAFGCYAAGNLMVRGVKLLTPVQLAACSLALSSLISVPAALWLEAPTPQSWSLEVWGALLWLAVVSTAFAFSLRYVLIRRAGAGFVANVGYLIPIVAVLIGFFFLDERITPMTVLAMLIILLSLYVTRRAGIKLRKIND